MAQPNILILLVDQLRRSALSCYGDPNVQTPNIDKLAANGVRFDAACSTYPICVPFRFTFMTGEYAHTRSVPALHWRMDPAERTLADEFNEAGYHSIYVGKWHLDGCKKQDPIPPERQGRWQKWLGFELRNSHFDTWYFEDDDPQPKPLNKYQTDGLFELTMDYLAGHDRAKPFCCVLSVEPPHFPYEAPEAYLKRWRDREIELAPSFEVPVEYTMPLSSWPGDDAHTSAIKRDLVRTYYAMIENLDDNVGRMMSFLEEQNLADETIVMLVSDHGEMGGMHALPTAMKDYPFEESVGIPLIFSGKPLSRTAVLGDPVSTEDLFPTICGLAGVTPRHDLPGINLSPLIRGAQDRLDREGIMLEFVREPRKPGAFYHGGYRAIRTRTLKYSILADEDGVRPWQLFDLVNDPYEQRNLIRNPSFLTKARELHTMLEQRIEETHDTFPICAPPE